jgi:FKBP-type peptidyl-prolyl cis-trans isomerase
MQDTQTDTKLIISIIVVFVFVAIVVGYGFTRMSAPAAATPADSSQPQAQTTTSTASLPSTPNQPTSMSSQDPIAQGKAFLAENAKQPGVTTLADGLQYKIVTAGTGPKPTKDQTVKVNYEGTLIDGTVFDSSYKRGQPIEFGVTQVIPGWTEVLQLMPVGSTWMVYIPSELAYGPRGAGGAIGPNETLIFKVELIAAHN